MSVPFIDLQAQYAALREEIDGAIQRVIRSCAFSGGPEVAAFEQAFARYCGVQHCAGVSSGTAALELLLRAYGIGPGDEVITTANTFFATAEAISLAGARPVFVDVEEETALLDPSLLEAAISPRTRAVIPVHLYGQPADMDAIRRIAGEHRLIVIEDSCQAHGARHRGKRAGALGDAAAFSFYPGKNLGAYGEAGAVTTDDAAIAERVQLLRDHGSRKKYEHEVVGRNDRMDGIQGAILAAKLPHLDDWNRLRRGHVERYRSLLGKNPAIRFFAEKDGRESAHHLFVIRVPERDRVQAELRSRGIDTIIHYPFPLHLQRAYRELGHREGDFPVTERLAREILSLPLFPELTEEQIRAVTDTLLEVM